MARNYRPTAPFSVAFKLLVPSAEKSKGTVKKEFPSVDDAPVFMGAFRTFGGTESTENGIYTVYDTAKIDTWYRPDIRADCRIVICETGEIFEIVGDPEDIYMRHQFLRFNVRKVGGEA